MDQETNNKLGELIIALARGDMLALDEIYKIMGKLLYSIGFKYFTGQADVEDAIEHFLEKLIKKAKKFKENKNAYAWLCIVYRNAIYNTYGHRKVESKCFRLQKEKLRLEYRYSGNERLENYLIVSEIFSKVTPYERKILSYNCFCQLSIAETAEILGKPKSTIQYQLAKIKRKVRNL